MVKCAVCDNSHTVSNCYLCKSLLCINCRNSCAECGVSICKCCVDDRNLQVDIVTVLCEKHVKVVA